MDDLTIFWVNIGMVMVIIGLLADMILLIIYGVWNPYIKKIRISREGFIKVIVAISVFSFLAGGGLFLMIFASSVSSAQSIRTDFSNMCLGAILCLGIYPILFAGNFMVHMRRGGFIQGQSIKWF